MQNATQQSKKGGKDQESTKIGKELVQLIRTGKYIRHNWLTVKSHSLFQFNDLNRHKSTLYVTLVAILDYISFIKK